MSLFVRTALFVLLILGVFLLPGAKKIFAQEEKRTVRINPDTEAVEASEVVEPDRLEFDGEAVSQRRIDDINLVLEQAALLQEEK